MNSNNNQNRLNNEEIRKIEAMIEKRNDTAGTGTPAPSAKKYLRKTSSKPVHDPTNSTIIMNTVDNVPQVKADEQPKPAPVPRPAVHKADSPSPVANVSHEDIKVVRKPVRAAVHDNSNLDNSRTISMPTVTEETKKVPPQNTGEDVYYIPLMTEDDDFEFEEFTDDADEKSNAPSGLKSLGSVLAYLAFVITVAAMLAFLIINVANDVFAFVKSDVPVTVVVPKDCTTDELAEILGDSGAVNFPGIFSFYTKFKKTEGEYIPGTYSVSPSLNYDMMLAEFKYKAPKRTTLTVTIPEGYTTDQIVELLISKGLGTYEGYERAINRYEYDFKFLEGTENFSENRFWRLDGYLYPDTYYYYSTSTEETVIYKMLVNFDNKFGDEYYLRAEELGMTVDELITLASMIQKEVKYADEFGYVSSVFHNRLNSPAYFPKLDSDATIVYAMAHEKFLARKALNEQKRGLNAEELIIFAFLNRADVREVLADEAAFEAKVNELFAELGLSIYEGLEIDDEMKISTKYESPYNTYTNNGLPPGPISNPSIDAIRYAMFPNKSAYYYFVSGPDGRTTFSKTYAEHQKAIDELY